MNDTLWKSIQQFDFDHPPGEYNFSIRLASENQWTKDFTEKAILEYKKFMYLAAISDVMVSPSAIVDTVWHQHLIFTQSYQDFCSLVGKQIQHVPSTHQKKQEEQFRLAKERTKRIYHEHFGTQPKAIWEYDTMLAGLKLEPAKIKTGFFVLYGVLVFNLLTVPFYYLLKPVYIHIDNPYFILGFLGLALPAYVILSLYTKNRFKQIARDFDRQSFVYHLKPFELVYLERQKLAEVINGAISELIHAGVLNVNAHRRIYISKDVDNLSGEQLQVVSVLKDRGEVFYPELLGQLQTRAIFRNTAKSMDAFKWHFSQSKQFARLFYLNFTVFAALIMFPLIRLTTGVVRDKPIFEIALLTGFLVIFMVKHLYVLNQQFCARTIPDLYKSAILPAIKDEQDWRWSYFLYGSAVLTATLVPLVSYERGRGGDGGGASSCGSCGSSCGSCGGCGGD